jgi:hypothetical protein
VTRRSVTSCQSHMALADEPPYTELHVPTGQHPGPVPHFSDAAVVPSGAHSLTLASAPGQAGPLPHARVLVSP